MKITRYILALVALIALTVSASAQSHRTSTLLSAGSITAGENSTTNLAAATRVDVPLYVNPDGSAPTITVVLTAVGTNANSTNVVTATFASLPDGSNELATASVAFMMTGTTRKVVATNISSALPVTNHRKLRLKTLAVDNTTADMNGHVITAHVVGFVP